MNAIMIAGGQGFTGRHITQRLAAGGLPRHQLQPGLRGGRKTGVVTLAQGSDHCFNFIHVRDAALATEGALVAPLAYSISSGKHWQLGDVAALVRPIFPAGCLQRTGAGRRFDLHGPFETARNGRSHAASPTTPHES